jgi:hypothetical protein
MKIYWILIFFWREFIAFHLVGEKSLSARDLWGFGMGILVDYFFSDFPDCGGNFWQFEKENFDSLKKKILTVWKGKFLTVWKRKFCQFEKGNFDSLKREILTVWNGKFWQSLVSHLSQQPIAFSIFTQSIPTQNFIEKVVNKQNPFARANICELYSPLNEVINKSRDLYLTVESNKTEKT